MSGARYTLVLDACADGEGLGYGQQQCGPCAAGPKCFWKAVEDVAFLRFIQCDRSSLSAILHSGVIMHGKDRLWEEATVIADDYERYRRANECSTNISGQRWQSGCAGHQPTVYQVFQGSPPLISRSRLFELEGRLFRQSNATVGGGRKVVKTP